MERYEKCSVFKSIEASFLQKSLIRLGESGEDVYLSDKPVIKLIVA